MGALAVVDEGVGPDGMPLVPLQAPKGAGDPLEEAYPEDLQHASLSMLQKHVAPGTLLPPALRDAAGAVEKAGRLLQAWIKRKQILAKELPILGKSLEKCHAKARGLVVQPAGVPTPPVAGAPPAEGAAAAAPAAAPAAPAAVGTPAPTAKATFLSFFTQSASQSGSSGAARRAGTSASFHGDHPKHAEPAQPPASATPAQPPAPAAPGQPPVLAAADPAAAAAGQPAVPGQQPAAPAAPGEQADDVDCTELRIPANVLVSRRAASEAYWAFDRALALAERKVGKALEIASVSS